jgi:aminobenzoyl-glutamate transport protein
MSWLLNTMGTYAVQPADGKIIAVDNLLSRHNIKRIFTEMVKNFALFPPLGMVLVTVIGIGVAERSGLVDTALKRLVTAVPNTLLPATLVFTGVMSNMAVDAGYIVLTPLGAVLFAGFGRHPLAGLATAFAGVSGGFSANLLLTSLDPLLGGLTTTAAQLVDKEYVVTASANYYFMIVSTLLITLVGTFVTTRIVEPRLGKWTPPAGLKIDTSLGQVSNTQSKALWTSVSVVVVATLLALLLVVPEEAPLRDPEHGLKPFYESLVPLLMILFLLAGLSYGLVAGTIKTDKDAINMSTQSMATLSGYIVLSFVAAQFIAYFEWSNMGLVLAIKGAEFLKAIGFQGLPLILGFILVTATVNLFIGSASAKWAIMAPVFVPMLMLMGYSPELTQAAYRVGDSISNIISPLLPYFPIVIAFAQRYQPNAGIGTLISLMVPYTVCFGIAWSLVLAIWYLFGLPLGPDVLLEYLPKN